MRLVFSLPIVLASVCLLAVARPQEPYNKDQAVNYARTWVQNGGTPLRNPSYPDMSANASDGGDCTNFISQAMRAGGWRNTATTSTTSDVLWWLTSKTLYSQTWTTAHGFFRHMNGGNNPGTAGSSYESWYRWDFAPGANGSISVNYGDIISADWQGDGIIDHTMIVTGFRMKPDGYAEVLVSYHSIDRKDLPIGTIQAAYPNVKFYRFGPLNQNLIIQPYQIRAV